MSPLSLTMMVLVFWLAYLGSRLFKRVNLPAVSAFLLIGVVAGPEVFNLISKETLSRLGSFDLLALSIVTFLIGEQLNVQNLRQLGKRLVAISLTEVILVAGLTYLAILNISHSLTLAILLGIIAITTAPITVVSIKSELKAAGELTNTLISAIAINNILAITAIGLILPFALHFGGNSLTLTKAATSGFINIIGSIFIGSLISLPLVILARQVETSGELLLVVLAHIGMAVALSYTLKFSSPFLSTMVAGMLTSTLLSDESHGRLVFDSLGIIAEPIYLIFFVLSGASLQFKYLVISGGMLAGYLLMRSLGKILGPFLGGLLAGLKVPTSFLLSRSFLPQSALAIGLALLIKDSYLVIGEKVLSVVLGGVIFFELVGPYFLKKALQVSGESEKEKKTSLTWLPVDNEGFKKILVLQQKANLSAKKINSVIQLGKRFNSSILLLLVERASRRSKTDMEQLSLKYMREAEEAKIDLEVRRLLPERIARRVQKIVEEESIDLVVLEVSARNRVLGRIFSGQTTRIFNRLSCPILIVKG
jgi:Kef-type K+ transport system membrane component KefB/nucleotide-binding universal stress UspA family protein